MNNPTKILIFGVAIAGLTLLTGFIRFKQQEPKLTELIAQCTVEANTPPKSADPSWKSGKLICDPEFLLYFNSADTPGIQGKIFAAARARRDNLHTFALAAAVIAALSLVPHLWYFLLARLREVSAAIKGK